MNEELDFSSLEAAPPAQSALGEEPSAFRAGEALRRAREAKGVHLVAVASALKVPTKYLEHLELGDLDALPDMVFAKALAASVCRNIGVNAAEVLQYWPVVNNPTLAKPEPATPMKPTVFDPYPDRRRPFRLLALGTGVLLILVGLAWLWLTPADSGSASADAVNLSAPVTVTQSQMTASDEPSPKADAASTLGAAEPVAASNTTLAQPPQTTVSSVSVAEGSASSSALPAPQAAETTPPGAPVSAGVTAPTQAPSESSGLVIKTLERAWIEVRNARDGVLISRIVPAGETMQWPMTGGPWSVVLGNVGGVRVEVNGQPRDLAADTQRGVARFSLE